MTRRLLALTSGALVGAAVVLAVRALADRYAAEGGLPTPLAAALAEVRDLLDDPADVRDGAPADF